MHLFLITTVEINKECPNENKQRLSVQSLLWQGKQPPTLASGTDSKAGRWVGKFYRGRAVFKRALPRGVWCEEAVGALEAWRPKWLPKKAFGFLWLVLIWKQKKKNLEKLLVINQLLAVWGQLLWELLFGFWGCLLEIEVLFPAYLVCRWCTGFLGRFQQTTSWFPRPVTVDCGPSSIFISGLAAVHLYIRPLTTLQYKYHFSHFTNEGPVAQRHSKRQSKNSN